MPTFRFNKLIRSKIKGQFERVGIRVHERPLGGEEFIPALLQKLREEVEEAIHAKDSGALLEELADIQEVLAGILSSGLIDTGQLKKKRAEKALERGGFSPACFCVRLEISDTLLQRDPEVQRIIDRLRSEPLRYPEEPPVP